MVNRRVKPPRPESIGAYLGIMGICLAAVAIMPRLACAMTPERFARSPAATAYRAGKFALALQEIDKLLLGEPQDQMLLRVRGMTLYQLNRMTEAETALEKALKANPDDPALLYWYAATLHKRGKHAAALATFERIARLSPRSRYGQAAVKSAAAIRVMTRSRATATEASKKPWSVSITAGSQFDDNVSLVNTDKLQSLRLFTQVDGSYTFGFKDGYSLTLEGRTHASKHLRRAADDYDLVVLGVGARGDRRTRIAGRPVRFYLGYSFDHTWLGGFRYSSTHTVEIGADTALWRNSITTIGGSAAINLFADRKSGTGDIFSRDGVVYGVILRHVQYLPGRRHYVWVAYTPEITRSRGRNFDAIAHSGSVGASFSLPQDLSLDLTATFGHTRYNHFIPLPRRLSRGQSYSAQLSKKVSEHFSLSVGYAHSFDDSNYKTLEYHRNVVTVSGRLTF